MKLLVALLAFGAGLLWWMLHGVPGLDGLPGMGGAAVTLGEDWQERLSREPDKVLDLLGQAEDPREMPLRDLQRGALRARRGQQGLGGIYARAVARLANTELSPLSRTQVQFLFNQSRLWEADPVAAIQTTPLKLEGASLPWDWLYLQGPEKALPIAGLADFEAACALQNQQVSELNGRAEVAPIKTGDTPVGVYVQQQLQLRRSWQGPDFYRKAAAYYRAQRAPVAWRYLKRSAPERLSLAERLEWIAWIGTEPPPGLVQFAEAELVGTAREQELLLAYFAFVRGDHRRARKLWEALTAAQRATPGAQKLGLGLAAAQGRWDDVIASCERLGSAVTPAEQLKWAVALEQLGRGEEARGHYGPALKDPGLDPGRRTLIQNRLSGGPLPTLVYWVEWKQSWRVVVVGEGVPHEVLPLIPLWRHVDAPWSIRNSANVQVVEAQPYFTRKDTYAALFKVTFSHPESEKGKYRWWLEATSPPAYANYPGRFCNRTSQIFNDHAAVVLDAEDASKPGVTALAEEGAPVRTRAGSLVCDFYRFRFDPPWNQLLLDAPMKTVSSASSPAPDAILAAFRPRRQGRYEEE
jgi:hypothetical protein